MALRLHPQCVNVVVRLVLTFRAKACLLRPDFVAEVQRVLEGSGSGGRGPVLLLGPPGSGKSCTLARVSQLVCNLEPR